MNIFILDEDPVIAAQMLCDKHVVKMALETAQILCTIRSGRGIETQYRPTHRNHPCVKWAANDPINEKWLQCHGKAICAEYTYRYGKIHASEKVIGDNDFPLVQPLTFVLAMPDKYKTEDAVESYRAYYIGDKSEIATWTKRAKPEWWIK